MLNDTTFTLEVNLSHTCRRQLSGLSFGSVFGAQIIIGERSPALSELRGQLLVYAAEYQAYLIQFLDAPEGFP